MRFFSACCSLLFLLGTATAQNLEQTIAYAHEAASRGDMSTAIASYRRALFFGAGDQQAQLSHALADCYTNAGEFSKATFYYDVAYAHTAPDNASARIELVFDKSVALLLAGEYPLARLSLANLPDSLSPATKRRQQFYHAIIHFQLGEFEAAEKAMRQLISSDQHEVVARLFHKNHKLKRFNPRTMQIMSYLLPGLGQAWCGDWRNAANSFVISAGFGALFGYAALNLGMIDAAISVLPWFQRYYLGGAKSVKDIAGEKIATERNDIYQALLDLIETTSKLSE